MRPEFNRIKQTVGVNRSHLSITPIISNKFMEVVKRTLGSVSSTGTSGMGSAFGRSGYYQRTRPGVAQAAGFKLAVVRPFADPNAKFLPVQILRTSETSPWDGNWRLTQEDPIEQVVCEPGLMAKDYSAFIVADDLFVRSTPYVTVHQYEGVWIAVRQWKYMLRLLPPGQQYKRNDCTPLPTEG